MKKKLKDQITLIATVAVITAVITFGATLTFGNNQTGAPANCKGECVALGKNKATPDTLAVKVGSYVQFNSADGKTHRLSIGEGGKEHDHKGNFSSGDFKGDEAWRVQFKDKGSFLFHDHYNPKISVSVVVYTPGKEYKVQ